MKRFHISLRCAYFSCHVIQYMWEKKKKKQSFKPEKLILEHNETLRLVISYSSSLHTDRGYSNEARNVPQGPFFYYI